MMLSNVTEIESVSFKGYLEKQRRVKTWAWNRYWFVLEDGQLAYFLDETLVEGRGLIDLGQANSIRAAPGVNRDYSFEIVVKQRNHVLCAETEQLRDQWLRLLQQGKLLRPQRTPSMNLARCNSISSDEDLSSLDSLATPPLTPKSPRTPNSPKFTSNPKPVPNKPAKIKINSPKLAKNNVKSSPSSIFSTSNNPSSKSEIVMLKSIRPLKTDLNSDPLSNHQLYQQYKDREGNKRNLGASKTTLTGLKSHKTPVTRLKTCLPPERSHDSHNGYIKSSSESGIGYESPKLTDRDSIRPVSSPGQLTRGKPVNKDERPNIRQRPKGFREASSSSDESDNGPDVSKPKLERRTSGSQKVHISPESSTGRPVVLRKVARQLTSLPPQRWSDSCSDSDSNEVFTTQSPPNANPQLREAEGGDYLDKCCERLSQSLTMDKLPIPDLPYPRLELTFRSAFDDIRLFLANNRSGDEIFPVPSLSERGGKAIDKLEKFIQTL